MGYVVILQEVLTGLTQNYHTSKPTQVAKISFSPVNVSKDMLPVEKRDFISLGSVLDKCAILR